MTTDLLNLQPITSDIVAHHTPLPPQKTHTRTHHPYPYLGGLLESVSEERGLVFRVMKQDVESDVSTYHVVYSRFHQRVEVPGRMDLIQQVPHLHTFTQRSYNLTYTHSKYFSTIVCI